MTTIRTLLPTTGFERPTAEEMRSLRNIVLTAHPWLRDHSEQEFSGAFTGVGFIRRLAAPRTDVYFHVVTGWVNALLSERLDMEPVSGVAVLAACLAAGDVGVSGRRGRSGPIWRARHLHPRLHPSAKGRRSSGRTPPPYAARSDRGPRPA